MQKQGVVGFAQRAEAVRCFTFLFVAAVLAMCSSPGADSSAILGRPIPDGYGRMYVLRAKQVLYLAQPVSISVDGRTVGWLASGTFLATDMPGGSKTLTVAALLSRLTAHFDLPAGRTVYILVMMEPSGLPPPRGAIGGAPQHPITVERGLFSIRFLDESSAMSALTGLSPAQ